VESVCEMRESRNTSCSGDGVRNEKSGVVKVLRNRVRADEISGSKFRGDGQGSEEALKGGGWRLKDEG
jgi:hypothetical protein